MTETSDWVFVLGEVAGLRWILKHQTMRFTGSGSVSGPSVDAFEVLVAATSGPACAGFLEEWLMAMGAFQDKHRGRPLGASEERSDALRRQRKMGYVGV